MRQTALFTKTRKEAPTNEVSKNAQLLIRAGFVNKEMAGVYSYLPLGLRVLTKIENIIREEMNAIGGQEVLLTTLQDPEVWKKSNRWDDSVVDNWFKSTFATGGEVGIANTHEEPLAQLLKQHIRSHADLPKYIYQIQTKFRNELRAKSGLMRGKEFLMKDLYSFSRSEEEFKDFYEKAADAYMRVFARAGLNGLVWRTFASGGSFSKFSDEFQAISEAGEDIVYIDEGKKIAVNKEVYTDEVLTDLGLSKENLKEMKSIEVGNIFPLGTRYSEAEGFVYKDEEGNDQYPVMGSYGIGLGRLLGTIAEILSDEKGLVWPESVAPFTLHLIEISGGDIAVKNHTEELYEKLVAKGIEVLYDDRDLRAGEKFADSDLIGIPTRIVVSKKSIEAGGIERVNRKSGKTEIVKEDQLLV